jgi:hypothetical protein
MAPRSIRNLFAAGDAGEFFLEALAFDRIGGFGELVGEFEEAVVLGLFGLQAGFDEIDQDAARGGMAGFGQGANPLGDARRQRHALADSLIRAALSYGLVDTSHDPILQQVR